MSIRHVDFYFLQENHVERKVTSTCQKYYMMLTKENYQNYGYWEARKITFGICGSEPCLLEVSGCSSDESAILSYCFITLVSEIDSVYTEYLL